MTKPFISINPITVELEDIEDLSQPQHSTAYFLATKVKAQRSLYTTHSTQSHTNQLIKR